MVQMIGFLSILVPSATIDTAMGMVPIFATIYLGPAHRPSFRSTLRFEPCLDYRSCRMTAYTDPPKYCPNSSKGARFSVASSSINYAGSTNAPDSIRYNRTVSLDINRVADYLYGVDRTNHMLRPPPLWVLSCLYCSPEFKIMSFSTPTTVRSSTFPAFASEYYAA